MSKITDFFSTAHLTMAAFLLRIWVALRCLMAGFGHFKDKADPTKYSMESYQKKMAAIGETQADWTVLPEVMSKSYSLALPWILISVGFWVLLGAGRQLGLFVAGLLFLSLSIGLGLLPDDNGVVQLGIQVALVAGALAMTKWDFLSLDGLLLDRIFRRKNPSTHIS